MSADFILKFLNADSILLYVNNNLNLATTEITLTIIYVMEYFYSCYSAIIFYEAHLNNFCYFGYYYNLVLLA